MNKTTILSFLIAMTYPLMAQSSLSWSQLQNTLNTNQVEVLNVNDVQTTTPAPQVHDYTDYEYDEGDNEVYVITDDKPQFPGGDQAMMMFLAENIKYPVSAYENNIQGRVICQFVVNKDGSITEIQVVRSVDPLLDKEAIRVIQSMPRWIPGRQGNKVVRVRFTLPVVFRIQ